MTNDQLWAAFFVALGVFQAWSVYRLLDSGKWMSIWGATLLADRRSHPIGFWFGVAWNVFTMIVLLSLGAYTIGPSILPMLGK